MTRQLMTSDDAIETTEQHTRPCSDCPFSRTSLKGWLGGLTVADWLQEAHGEVLGECHVLVPQQCAGMAIYRANMSKVPRNPEALILPKDRVTVFATPIEFSEHHTL